MIKRVLTSLKPVPWIFLADIAVIVIVIHVIMSSGRYHGFPGLLELFAYAILVKAILEGFRFSYRRAQEKKNTRIREKSSGDEGGLSPVSAKFSAAVSLAAHRVTAPTISQRLDMPLEDAQAAIREHQRRRQRRGPAKEVIADCMRRLGISGTGKDPD